MNRQALIELRRVVLEAPDELFNMHVFEEKLPCGTVRCAAGWAAVDPWFKENLPKIASNSWAFNWCTLTEHLGKLFDLDGDDAVNREE